MVNANTGHSLRRTFVDSETGETVEKTAQIKGYELSPERYVTLEPEEIAGVMGDGAKTLQIEGFVPRERFDELYLEKPYYLAPQDKTAADGFILIREALKKADIIALARATLFRRSRKLAVAAYGSGLIAEVLHFDYEVRGTVQAFSDISSPKITKQMLDLAEHIIGQKMGSYDPAAFKDRYEQALGELVRAKQAGKAIPLRKAKRAENVVDLLDALHKSAAGSGRKVAAKSARQSTKKSAPAGKAAPRKPSRRTHKKASWSWA